MDFPEASGANPDLVLRPLYVGERGRPQRSPELRRRGPQARNEVLALLNDDQRAAGRLPTSSNLLEN